MCIREDDMNRLKLRIYEPPAEPSVDETSEADQPHILPFADRSRTTIISGRLTGPADRARLLRQNSICPECSQTDVEPIELRDAVISPKSRLPIPGTATIVGFHCNCCENEWPVYELTTRRNG